MRVYLDTSVPNACLDERRPERRAVNAVNALEGLGAVEILTPPEL